MRVQYAEGEPQLYTLPLAYATGADAEHLATTVPHAVIAQVQRAGAAPAGYLYDPMWSARFAQGLLTTVAGRRRVPGQYGVLAPLATPVLRTARAAPRAQLTPSVLQAAHNNTTVRYGTHVVLKLFRCIDEGLNPDLELGRFLTDHGFAHTPPVAGALTYTPHRGESMSVAIVQRYVPNQGELRDVLQTALHAYFARVRGRRAPATPPLCAQTVLAYGGHAPSPAVQAVLGEVRALAQVLGQRTAEMHLTLASDPTAPAFAPVPFTAFLSTCPLPDRAEPCGARLGRAAQAAALAPRRGPGAGVQAPHPARAPGAAPPADRAPADRPQRLRCHGDFHLGQVLVTGANLLLVDFEGQPQQRVSERQLKRSPLVDVASMLWSLQSAPAMALRTAREGAGDAWPEGPHLAAWAHLWAWWSGTAFVHAYLATAAAGAFLPATPAALGLVLEHCWLASVVTALHTTLDTQPQWAGVPINGLLHLLEGPRVRRAHPERRDGGGRPRDREGGPRGWAASLPTTGMGQQALRGTPAARRRQGQRHTACGRGAGGDDPPAPSSSATVAPPVSQRRTTARGGRDGGTPEPSQNRPRARSQRVSMGAVSRGGKVSQRPAGCPRWHADGRANDAETHRVSASGEALPPCETWRDRPLQEPQKEP